MNFRCLQIVFLGFFSLQAFADSVQNYGSLQLGKEAQPVQILSATGLGDYQSVGTKLQPGHSYEVRLNSAAGFSGRNYLLEFLGPKEQRIAIWLPNAYVVQPEKNRYFIRGLQMIPVQKFDFEMTDLSEERVLETSISMESCERSPMVVNTGLVTNYYCDGTKVDWFQGCAPGERVVEEQKVSSTRSLRLEFRGDRVVTLETSPLSESATRTQAGECRRISDQRPASQN